MTLFSTAGEEDYPVYWVATVQDAEHEFALELTVDEAVFVIRAQTEWRAAQKLIEDRLHLDS
jgi:hypothetical protein